MTRKPTMVCPDRCGVGWTEDEDGNRKCYECGKRLVHGAQSSLSDYCRV